LAAGNPEVSCQADEVRPQNPVVECWSTAG
jgi:hypothetical protein